MYEVAICDDSSMDRELLKRCIRELEEAENIIFHEYDSGKTLLQDMEKIRFNLIFLDIQMDELDGEKVADEIRKCDSEVVLTFITGYAEPTLHTIKVQPFRFIKKNMSEEEKKKDISESIKRMVEKSQVPVLLGKIGSSRIVLKPDDIVYIEKYKKAVRVHISDAAKKAFKKYMDGSQESDIRISDKLENIYHILSKHGFGYPHDSYIINFKYMISCTENEIRLEGFSETTFKVTRSKAVEFNRLKKEYLTAKYRR